MLSIYICEDDTFQLEQLKHCIENCILINDYDMKIKGAFTSPSSCISAIQSSKPLHGIYFLDIDLKAEYNGIELASQIRKLDPRAFILFITTHEEMLTVTFQYKVEALDFIIKESSTYLSQRINECLSNIVEKQCALSPVETDKVFFSHLGKKHFIPKKDTYYINATNDHKYTVHHSSGLFETRGNLNNLMTSLSSEFFLCHRGCIVNLNHIMEIDPTTKNLILDNLSECPCSKKNLKVIQKILIERSHNY